MVYRDKESILDLTYQSKYFWTFLGRFKILRVIEENVYLRKYNTLQQGTHKILLML